MAQSPTFDDIQSASIPTLRRGGSATPAQRLPVVSTLLEGPYRLVLAFVFLYYAFPVMALYPGVKQLRPLMVLLVVTGGWLLLEKTSRHEPFIVSWPDSHALLAFLGVCSLGTWTSFWPGLTVAEIFSFSKGVAIYFLIINVISDRRRLRGLYWAWVLGGGFAAFSALQMSGGGRLYYTGTFRNPNDFAMALIIIVPLAVALLRDAKPLARYFVLGNIAVMSVAIYMTNSRGGLIGFGAAMAVLAARVGGATRRALIALALVVALASPLLAQYWARERSYSNLEDDGSFQNRLVSVGVGWAMFLDSPLLGIGFGNSHIRFSDYAPQEHRNDPQSYIHNTFAQMLAETGFLGTLMYMTAFGFALFSMDRVARQAARGRHRDLEMHYYASALESALVGFAICSLAGPYLAFWVPLLLISACTVISKILLSERLATPVGPVAAAH